MQPLKCTEKITRGEVAPISEGMEGTVEKKSAVLGRDTDLTVQFVRFSVSMAPDSGETVARKILKVNSMLVYTLFLFLVTREDATCKFEQMQYRYLCACSDDH